jgi:hypothetical protein
VSVLLGVGAVAVAVLEVDAEVLDGLARELLTHAAVDRLLQSLRQVERAGEGRAVGRELLERAVRDRAETCRRVGFEQVGTAVHRVHRLPPRGLAGESPGELCVRVAQPLRNTIEVRRREGRLHAAQSLLPRRRDSMSGRKAANSGNKRSRAGGCGV